MQQNPPCELSSCFSTVLLFLLVPKSVGSLKQQTEKIDKVNSVFLKRKINSRHAGIQSKIYKKKKKTCMYFTKKQEYKYILGKSRRACTNISLFLIISSKIYISYPKILMKSAATVVFCTKCPRVIVLKKMVNQLNLFYCHLML